MTFMTVLKKNIILVLAAVLIFSTVSSPFSVFAMEKVNAKGGCLVDFESGKVLMEENGDKRCEIASMTKIMTLNLIFDEIERGNLKFDDKVTVSKRAMDMGGSQVFLNAGDSYLAKDLIKSIVISSANDASVAMAEKIGGSVEGFVEMMNQKAAGLKMNDTNFKNVTGLPQPDAFSTPLDVAKMMRELISHKDYFSFSKIWMDEIKHQGDRVTMMSNTNKLLRTYDGCDGGKTGFTNGAMHCHSATAERNGLRLISVVCGAPSSKERFAEVVKMFDYGFGEFKAEKVVKSDTPLAEKAKILRGKIKEVEVYPSCDFSQVVKRREKGDISTRVNLFEIKAPKKCGDVVGKLEILEGNVVVKEIDLILKEDVEKASILDYLKRNAG